MKNLLAHRPGLRREQLERPPALMERALLSVRLKDYKRYVAMISLPGPDDRHISVSTSGSACMS